MPKNIRQIDFVNYLLDEKVITQEQAVCVRSRWEKSESYLGRLLLQLRFLTLKQLLQLLDLQLENPGVRLGALGVRHGLLTQEQVEEALNLQKEVRKHLATCLLEEEILSKDKMFETMIFYIKDLEDKLQDMQTEALRQIEAWEKLVSTHSP